MEQHVKSALEGKESEFEKALLDHCKGLLVMSRGKMSRYYDKWDFYDSVYRGESQPDGFCVFFVLSA